jgi:ribonuclease Z
VAQNADWLLTEAFCLHSEAERYKPYEKHHSTALDAGKTAAMLHARNLIIYHTEDDSLVLLVSKE